MIFATILLFSFWLSHVFSVFEFVYGDAILLILLILGVFVEIYSSRFEKDKTNTNYFHVIIISFCAYNFFTIFASYFYESYGEASFGTLIKSGVMPLLMSVLIVKNSNEKTLLGFSYPMLMLAVLVIFGVVASFLPFFSSYTVETFNIESVSSSFSIGNYRRALVGFPGIVSGGIVSGMLVVVCLAKIISINKDNFLLIFILLVLCSCVIGVLVTDVRQNILLIPVGLSFVFLYQKNLSLFKLVFTAFIIVFFVLPFVYGYIYYNILYQVMASLSAGLSEVGRSYNEDVLSFTGRRDVWMGVSGYLFGGNINIFGDGIRAESILGLYKYFPGSENSSQSFIQSFHSHNSVMNLLITHGPVFLVLFLVIIVSVLRDITKTSNLNLEYLALFVSCLLYGVFESNLSPQYMYFFPLFVFACIKIKNHASNMKVLKN